MDYQLDDSHPKYIRVNVLGALKKDTFIEVLGELFNHPDYDKKNTFWDFTKGSFGMNLLDIQEIVCFLRLYKPKEQNFANKSAFLVSNQMHKTFVNVYISLSTSLPFTYKVSTEQIEVEKFLTGTD